MTPPEAKYMRRKMTTGDIEADLDEICILINYEMEITFLGDNGEELGSKKKKDIKRIHLQSLNENSNIPQLAQQIVQKCALIHESKLPLIEGLLEKLQERKVQIDRSSVLHKTTPKQKPQPTEVQDPNTPSMDKLEQYIEKLYEGYNEKLKACKSILELARNQDYLEDLLADETLFGALSRLLREEGTKDLELGSTILLIFFSFSNFSQFHPFLSQNSVGSICLKIILVEIERRNKILNEMNGSSKQVAALQKKLDALKPKQEHMLSVCFHLLLNLAEDVSVEKKMKKRNIVLCLLQVLEWDPNLELVLIILTFLKKLSIFKENAIEMAKNNTIQLLNRYIPHENEELLNTTLRLLVNLSFNKDLQQQMIKVGLIPKLVDLLPKELFRITVLKLLYHLSMDDKSKSLFTFTDCIPMVLKLVLETPPDQFVGKELIALAVNLTANERNAELMADGDNLKMLMLRAKKTADPLLMKMIRNISTHEGKCKEMFVKYVPDLVQMLRKCKTDDLLVEILGTMANLSSPNIDWSKILMENDLIEFLGKHLAPGFSEDDIILEVVILIGTVITDKKSAQLLANTSIIPDLVALLLHKQDDDELVLQTIFTFFKLMQHKQTRVFLLSKTNVVLYLIDLLMDKNAEIRKQAAQTLDIVMEYDKEWARKIREKKFQAHNSKWCEVVAAEERAEPHRFEMYNRGEYDDGPEDFGLSYASNGMIDDD